MSTFSCPYGQVAAINMQELVVVMAHWAGRVDLWSKMGARHMPSPPESGDDVCCAWVSGGKRTTSVMSPSLFPATGPPQEAKGHPQEDCMPQIPQAGICGRALAILPPPSLCLKFSFPSFVLPTGVSPSPRRPPSSVSSAKGGMAWPGGAQTCSPSSTYRYRSLAQPPAAATRLSSVSSHDSGFISQDAAYSKPPSPMPSDITSQVQGGWSMLPTSMSQFPLL